MTIRSTTTAEKADFSTVANSHAALSSFLSADVCLRVIDQLGIVSVTDLKGRILYVNDEFVRISGFTREELIGQNHRIINSGHHSTEFFRDMYRKVASGKVWRSPIRNRAKDGKLYWVDALVLPLTGPSGKLSGYVSVRLDITNAAQAHLALRARDKLLQGVLENFPGGIAIFDKTLSMVFCNTQQRKLLGYPDELFADGLPDLETLYRFNAVRGEYGSGDVEELVQDRMSLARKNKPHSFERSRPNGTYLEVRGAPLDDGGFVSTHLDITQRKRDQEMIEKLALHDALTGLANRRLLRDRMQAALGRVKRGDKLALLYLDLDRFKAVNDIHGHPVGDALLIAVSERLKNNTREMDTVARLGGDEFAVIQLGIASISDAAELANRLIQDISAPYKIGRHTLSIGTSVGIAIAPDDAMEADGLLNRADLALYQVKGAGRGSYRFFEQEMDTRMQARRAIEVGLRDALKNNQLELAYQPIVSTTDRTVTSFEALVRWNHPERGFISAGEFVPIAEETGLIGPIGDWVLRQAISDASQWPDHMSVSVNVSVAQFQAKDLRATVREALGDTDPRRLVIEITESTLMQKDPATLAMLNQVRNLGVRFALDDFGTGYSSLSYLQSFPFDKLKIDRSFICASSDRERSDTLLSAMASLGRALRMTTIAEGIESEAQFEHIKSQGCCEAQGFLFSKGVRADEIVKLIQRRL